MEDKFTTPGMALLWWFCSQRLSKTSKSKHEEYCQVQLKVAQHLDSIAWRALAHVALYSVLSQHDKPSENSHHEPKRRFRSSPLARRATFLRAHSASSAGVKYFVRYLGAQQTKTFTEAEQRVVVVGCTSRKPGAQLLSRRLSVPRRLQARGSPQEFD